MIGYIKGKSAIHIARNYMGHRKNYTGQHFWARGYHVSTVGRDEEAIRAYIKGQEEVLRAHTEIAFEEGFAMKTIVAVSGIALAASIQVMAVNSTGNVGVGTDDPGAKLDLRSTAAEADGIKS